MALLQDQEAQIKKTTQNRRQDGTMGVQVATGFLFTCVLAGAAMLVLALYAAGTVPHSQQQTTNSSNGLTNSIVGNIHQGAETTLPTEQTVAAIRGKTAKNDFTLFATPDTKSTNGNTTIIYDIRVIRSEGFTKPITLSTENVPAPVTVKTDPEIVSGTDEASTLTITVPSDAPVGSFDFTVIAKTDSVQKRADASFSVSPLVMSNSKLIELKPMNAGNQWEARIGWDTDATANAWVEYAPDDSFTAEAQTYSFTAADEQNAKQHALSLTYLQPNTVYHYRMKSVDAFNNMAVSADHEFITAAAK